MPTVIDRHAVQELVQEGAQRIDVLGARDYDTEHLPGAINIPLKNLDRATAKRLDPRKPVITYCRDYQWDMSARAASRLATLGFTHVYRYQAGRTDWFAAGLPREGRDAHVPRVADVAKRDVRTCRLDERVGDVRDRVGRHGGEPLVIPMAFWSACYTCNRRTVQRNFDSLAYWRRRWNIASQSLERP